MSVKVRTIFAIKLKKKMNEIVSPWDQINLLLELWDLRLWLGANQKGGS